MLRKWSCLIVNPSLAIPYSAREPSAVAVFIDPDEAVFPRWIGHVSAWCAVLLLPAVLLPFFKEGPLAWDGIFQFWLAAAIFFGWFAAMSVGLIGAIKAEPAVEGLDAGAFALL